MIRRMEDSMKADKSINHKELDFQYQFKVTHNQIYAIVILVFWYGTRSALDSGARRPSIVNIVQIRSSKVKLCGKID